jgi:hypothetical protein
MVVVHLPNAFFKNWMKSIRSLVSNLATQLCFFWLNFSPNFDLIFFLISTYRQRIFHGKNDPNLPDFKEKRNPHRQII